MKNEFLELKTLTMTLSGRLTELVLEKVERVSLKIILDKKVG